MMARRASAAPYLLAYLALLLLAGVSLAFSRAVHWPHWDLVIDLAVATMQGGLVMWVFMHLSETGFQVRLAIGVSLSLLLTLLFLVTADVATRQVQPPAPRPGPSEAFYEH
ncbi:MAG TPA: hypothetical protein VMT03_20040 [Polyangia bacterium]|nr:hypothetical protein [Polyangia bacterium]